MTAGVFGRLPRIALIACAIALVTGTLAYAATTTLSTPSAAPVVVPGAAEPDPLVVPDVRKQAYVFAKGSLEQHGFAWRVDGSVPGFAANVVIAQSPAPGVRVIADGAPIIVLRLSRNGSYGQEGIPESRSPYPGKRARVFGVVVPKPKPAPAKVKPAPAKPAPAKPAPVKPKPVVTPAKKSPAKPKPAPAKREREFAPAGAPAEPNDEILLTTRAKRLAAWVEKHPKRSRTGVGHWLYQHNWIVTGA
ncbi:MAG: PASTA domain-containing protein, partial [Gaiellaceae bacterium]